MKGVTVNPRLTRNQNRVILQVRKVTVIKRRTVVTDSDRRRSLCSVDTVNRMLNRNLTMQYPLVNSRSKG